MNDEEDDRLRSVALLNAQQVLLARRRAEEELRKQSEWLRVTLSSIGDAVISTDAEGRITFMNGVAESLTGWQQADAMGHLLPEVFDIINGPTGKRIESPATRALREDVVVGLANHTILIAKDGTRHSIDDSAAPIRDEEGRVLGCVLTFRDVSERFEAEQALRESEAFNRGVLESSPDCIKVLDLDGRLLRMNVNGLRLMEIDDFASIEGRFMWSLWPEAGRSGVIAAIEAARVSGTGRVQGLCPTVNGKPKWWDVVVAPIRGEGERVERFVMVSRDITDLRHAETEREALLASERRARAEAERASRLKEDFLAMLSHELRTPLNAIIGWTHILRKNVQAPELFDQAVNVIERNARLQAQLIADLLDMSRIVSGKMRLDVQHVELAVVVEAALDSIRPAADAKEIRIQSILAPITEPVRGDPARLQQVVWNLLSNAVKFTPRGGEVRMRVACVDGQVEISVEDTGKGIKAEFLPHVFERFRQADSSAAREQGGLGLGLAIVKQLVELHGGSVRVDSAGEGCGAKFTVQLPFAPTAALTGTEHGTHALPRFDLPDLTGLRVLVVDDEPDARDLVRRVLEECAAEVVLAGSADEALDAVDHQRIDVILSDIGMPERDGYALMRAIRERGLRIPAAALTAFAGTEDRKRALHSGYQTHLTKPVEPTELLAIVASLAQVRRLRGEAH